MSEIAPRRVLIAEDNPIMADVMKRSLSRSGLDVVIARNGQEATEIVQEQSFDLVITDLRMPRMNGDEFVRNLRMTQINCTVPVIFVSGKGLEVDTEQLRKDLQIAHFLYKPFSPSELNQVVHSCLQRESTLNAPTACGRPTESHPSSS